MSDFSISPGLSYLFTIFKLSTFNGSSFVSRTLNEFTRSFFKFISKSTNLFWNKWFGDLLETTCGVLYAFTKRFVDVFTGFSVGKIWSESFVSTFFNTVSTFFLVLNL